MGIDFLSFQQIIFFNSPAKSFKKPNTFSDFKVDSEAIDKKNNIY